MRRLLTLVLLLLSGVSAPSTATVYLSEPEAVTIGDGPSSGSAYAYTNTVNGTPVHWDACAPIHWVFRASGAPAGAFTVLKQVIAEIARDTTTAWVYDGQVSNLPTSTWLPRTVTNRAVLVGWSDAAHSNLLRAQGQSVLAVTQTSWVPTRGSGKILSAVMALDGTERLTLSGAHSWRTVLLHEFGHAMGLAHAGGSSQLMYSNLSRSLSGLQTGDLTGLRRVGRAAGCL